MSRKAKSAYTLTPAAITDLDEIWDYTARTWSVAQAETYLSGLDRAFAHLCEFPLSNRERTEINPPVRLHHYERHLIIYQPYNDDLTILRVVHNRAQWQTYLDS